MARPSTPIEIRMKNKYKILDNGCWEWSGKINFAGYGLITKIEKGKQKYLKAHRVSYEIHRGGIPGGLVIDHICRKRYCINPDHLRVVTRKQNSMENSLSVSALNSVKKECIRGHKFSVDNTRKNKHGHRMCIKCCKIRNNNRHKGAYNV